MAIELRPLNTLDLDTVQAALAETVQRVQDDNPAIDLRRGVFAELLAYYHAVLDTQRRVNIADYLAARSLRQIEADPTLSDPDLVDDVLSNFKLTRKLGEEATGEITIIVNDDTTVVIPQGSLWQARGLAFVTPRVYTAKLEAAQATLPGDRILTPTTGGNWAFTIGLVAQAVGSDSNVPKDTLVVPDVAPRGYVSSYAAGDFTGGSADETNTELISRLQEGIAAKALSNRVNMAAALRDVDAFSRIVAMSIIGHGDAELLRAFHSIFPLALAGRCDWYIRTSEQTVKLTLTKTASLVEKKLDGTGVWQLSVGRSDAPGFYEFVDIRVADTGEATGGFTITEDTRGYDLTGGGFLPDIANEIEAAYSPYSTAVLKFHDDETDTGDLVVGDTKSYTVAAVCLPTLADIQAHVSSRDVRHYGGDCLVKAPIPAFTAISLTVHKRSGDDNPDVDGMKNAVAVAINSIGFAGKLYASQLQDAISPFLLPGQRTSAIDMLARVRYPDGTESWLQGSETLVVPDDPANMVTARTVQFFTTSEDIGVTIVTSIPTDS